MKKIIAVLSACLLCTPLMTNAADLFVETFEDLPLGDIAGTNGWTGGGIVQNETIHGGTNVLSLLKGTTSRTVSNANVIVEVEFYAKFAHGGVSKPTETNTAVAIFQFNTDGNLVAYSNTVPIIVPDVTFPTNKWHLFKAELDYVDDTWSMYVDGTNYVKDFAFYSAQEEFKRIAFQCKDALGFFDDITIKHNKGAGQSYFLIK